MARVERMTADNERQVLYAYECPACGISHAVRVAATDPELEVWKFNGNLDRPTFYPSVGAAWEKPDKSAVVCHAVIEDGRIRYLPDCLHEMAGKTVELPELT